MRQEHEKASDVAMPLLGQGKEIDFTGGEGGPVKCFVIVVLDRLSLDKLRVPCRHQNNLISMYTFSLALILTLLHMIPSLRYMINSNNHIHHHQNVCKTYQINICHMMITFNHNLFFFAQNNETIVFPLFEYFSPDSLSLSLTPQLFWTLRSAVARGRPMSLQILVHTFFAACPMICSSKKN